MSKWDTLEVERHGRVMLTRFNRPEKLNAMNPETYGAFVEAIEEANADPSIGAIVSTGKGRAYSAGADNRMVKQPAKEGVPPLILSS